MPKNYDDELKMLKQREKNVSRLEDLKAKLDSEHQKKIQELENFKEKLLSDQDKMILERKNDLLKIQTQIAEAIKKKADVTLELQSRINSLDDEVKKARLDKLTEMATDYSKRFENYTKSLQVENEKILKNLSQFFNWNQNELSNALSNLTKQYEELHISKSKLIDKELEVLSATKIELDKKLENYADIEKLKSELEIKEKTIKRKEDQLEGLVNIQVREKHKEIYDDLKKNKELYQYYYDQYNSLNVEYEKIRNEYLSTENLSNIALKKENERLKKEKSEMVEKYGVYTNESFEEIKYKAARTDMLEKRLRELNEETHQLMLELDEYRNDVQNVESLKYQNDQLKTTIQLERSILAKLKDDIDNLESRIDNKKATVIAAESIETPIDDFQDLSINESETIDEIKWLDKIIDNCINSGFSFSRRLFYSFHTCLKTNDMSPLTVLAGVSGTGKSKLPQLYSRFGGLYFLALPVQPDWDSPQSLFGYYNSIEKRFNATTLLRALVSFQKDKSVSETRDSIYDLSDKLLIVLLDEMNLAHVELYFSDLLSKLEEKRGEDKDISFEVDLGAGNGKYKVHLTDNVIWVGTMNEDETTKSLSDKVVDRGSIISFPRPSRFERYRNTKLLRQGDKISKEVWNKWINEKIYITDEEITKYMDIITKINFYLKLANRGLGHRVWQSIENYMISHPIVKRYEKDEEKKKTALKYAFEEALVHKVITKLRGIETEGELYNNCLSHIKEIIDVNASSLSKDFENAMQSITGTFVWDSAEYLDFAYDLE